MNVKKTPEFGEISSWTFTAEKDRAIRLRIYLKDSRKEIKRTVRIDAPIGTELLYHEPSDSFYVASLDGKRKYPAISKKINEISRRLAKGMNQQEWECALPEFFRDRSTYSVGEAIEEYYQARLLGTPRIKKAGYSTRSGLKSARRTWAEYGKDMNIYRFQKSFRGDGSEDRELRAILWGFVDFLRTKGLSVPTQINYLGYVKDALRYVAEDRYLAFPDLSKVSVSKPEVMPISITNPATLQALANLDPDDWSKQWQQEAVIVTKLMFFFGYRIGDAVSITRNNFTVTDQGIFIRMNSQKSKTPTNKLVPVGFYEKILPYMEKWEGRVVVTQNAATLPRVREGINTIVKNLPGMDQPVQVLRQKPDGSTELVWSTLAAEFSPHMLRTTSGTLYHLLTGRGAEHLGNTTQVFNRHYKDLNVVNLETEKAFHRGLGV